MRKKKNKQISMKEPDGLMRRPPRDTKYVLVLSGINIINKIEKISEN
jgi:hypothetical protein